MNSNKKQALIWLKKARTSIDKIITMIEEDTYCIDVIQQNLAAIGLIKSANVKMLESHLSCCFTTAAKSDDETRINEMIWEVLTIVKTAQNK